MPAQPELTQAERDKAEIRPDIDFRDVASRPFDALSKNEIGMFKWSGVYHQLQAGFFMVRLRVPGGLLTSAQLRRAGELASEHAQNELCITTRQCLQFHWVSQADIYKVIEGMAAVGVLTTNACGDVCRNVVGCPMQGVCRHEIGDSRRMLMRIADDPELLHVKRNLPRKHKINVSGCSAACGMLLMNCQGWHPVARPGAGGAEEVGWAFYAGGGLGSLPRLARPIFDWVPEDLVVPVARATVEAHHRFGNRRQRRFARLKIVVDTFGPGAFARQLLTIMRERNVRGLERLEAAASTVPDMAPIPYEGEGLVPERVPGKNTVRVMIPRSVFTGDDAAQFATWAETYGDGTIMFTQRQNLEFRGVPDASVPDLLAALADSGLHTTGFEHVPDVVACVGTTMCNLAVADTPHAYRAITTELAPDEDLWRSLGPLRINMNGCPNSCAHHWIADIGLRGRRSMCTSGSEEGFSLYVGGRLDGPGHIAEHVTDLAGTDVVPVLRQILSAYLAQREDEERFGDFARRLGGAGVAAVLGTADGEDTEPVYMRNRRLQPVFDRVFKEAAQ